MRQTSYSAMQCSMAHALEAVGDWWSPLILRDLYFGFRRFEDLVEDLGISRNLLTARLRTLTEHGIVDRSQYQDRPPRHEYTLSEAGRELVPILMALTAWGDRWTTPDGGPPVLFRHAACGQEFVPSVTCSACGRTVRSEDVEPVPGPGAKTAPGTMLVHRFVDGESGA
ncbi:winged helix-turn-helix transcriptional regulator [Streptomyces sp. NPDC020681]|uniref:winged helix-turn-helix transcriptional regulator n=1 Tax=Streptomyces sp. NPDC020681 TaxID=3365083 RepID=UPI0037909C27